MLYVTTRNNRDTFTAPRALMEDRAPDGGFYLPFRAPSFSNEELDAMAAMPFCQRIAEVLNRLFPLKLTRWDVEFAIGRNAVKLASLRHRIILGEFWHNPEWTFRKLETELSQLLRKDMEFPGSWLRIAIRAALLTAVCLETVGNTGEKMDISTVSGDLLWGMGAWYARQWGIPIGDIILCCNENKCVWDLICQGQLRTDTVAVTTELPEGDIAIAEELERLICGCGDREEVERYLSCCRRGSTYYAEGPLLSALQKGNYVSVVSSSRIPGIITGAMGTHGYLLSPGAALAYGGLLDYRAKKGSMACALVICENSPVHDTGRLSGILGIPEQELKTLID